MMRKAAWLIILLLLGAACGGTSPAGEPETEPVSEQEMTANALTTAIAASAQPAFDAAELLANLETAVATWNSQNISRYQVTVRHRQPTWNTQNITLTVEDGVVLESEQTCFPEQNCILQEVEPATVTIEALFETAEAVIGFNDPETEITFNQTYGYPNAIIYEDATWTIDSFQLLTDE